ncbi:DUF1254 domain-containing protein [Luteimicrobium xylanilyticum]|uniref:DUF1254 domain-containing protein n=1 Tax=Luteimicrobium xylanilyticum TaxID=1133546 RepID=A0A5P9Q8T7_9MICO|nr:DUF1254 domain-containing protein [Luteimicrobium xylanilyticum]QFU96825.1 hypothetical protein KDY119_00315 [Luteimicrobium xylanilyticum]
MARWDDLRTISLERKYLSDEDRRTLLDEHFFERAMQVYLGAMPAVNMVAIRDGSQAVFGSGYNVLPIWKSRMDARCKVPTPNADVVYAMSYLDLKADGPLVVQAPPGILGMLSDFWQHPLSDVGMVGPDRGQGGQYLLVPPHFDGPIPDGYYVLHSSTYNVFLFWRAFLTPGPDGPDPAKAVETLEQTLIYPLRESNPARWERMEFPDASGVDLDMLFPRDATYFDRLAELIEYEPVDSGEMYLRGQMASLGIIKGQPFAPDDHLREILQAAAEVAPRLSVAVNTTPDSFPDREYYTGEVRRRWVNGWPDLDELFRANSYLSLDMIQSYFLIAYSASPAMAKTVVGGGSKYPSTFFDADGDYLSGERSYRLHLPPHPPARLFWSVTIYDPTDGTMIRNGQPFPSINSLDGRVTANDDGSFDLYLGPQRPDGVPEANWLRTNPEEGYLLNLRLYGPTLPFYDGSWIPDDPVRVD